MEMTRVVFESAIRSHWTNIGRVYIYLPINLIVYERHLLGGISGFRITTVSLGLCQGRRIAIEYLESTKSDQELHSPHIRNNLFLQSSLVMSPIFSEIRA